MPLRKWKKIKGSFIWENNMKENEFKPHLPSDKQYLQSIANSIKSREILEEIHFEYLNDVLRVLGINIDPYKYITLEKTDSKMIDKIIDRSFNAVFSAEFNGEVKKSVMRTWSYLAENDELDNADLIFVFGGAGLNRVKAAVLLYKEGCAGKIMFTGMRASYMNDFSVSEAEFYKKEAIKLGVGEKDIIIETKAKNTPENVLFSKKILKEMNFLPKTVILVSSQFHIKRAYLTFKSVVDWSPRLIRYSVEPFSFNGVDFYKTKKGWSYMFYEYLKIYYARLLKHI
jgi:uncharacterized SAM-binding protein YcdF (DUF218 family)